MLKIALFFTFFVFANACKDTIRYESRPLSSDPLEQTRPKKKVLDPLIDTDKDGLNNGEEIALGLDPKVVEMDDPDGYDFLAMVIKDWELKKVQARYARYSHVRSGDHEEVSLGEIRGRKQLHLFLSPLRILGNGKEVMEHREFIPTLGGYYQPCYFHLHRPVELESTSFSRELLSDLMSSYLLLKVGGLEYSLGILAKENKVVIHYPLLRDGREGIHLIVQDIWGKNQQFVPISLILRPFKKREFIGIRMVKRPSNDHAYEMCASMGKLLGDSHNLKMWRSSWGMRPDFDKQFYAIGDGMMPTQRDYIFSVHSLIIGEK